MELTVCLDTRIALAKSSWFSPRAFRSSSTLFSTK